MNDRKAREKERAFTARRNLQAVNAGYDYSSTIVTPEEYRYLYGGHAATPSAAPDRAGLRPKAKRRWRFKLRSVRALLVWGVILFAALRILVFPFVEGTYLYIAKDLEIRRLQKQYAAMQHQLTDMKKTRDKMKTIAYVEERGHQIGLVKSNEAKMVVVESSGDGRVFRYVPRKNEVYGY